MASDPPGMGPVLLYDRAVRARHPELAGVDSVILVLASTEARGRERVLTRSAAALAIADYLGGRWKLARLARVVPARLRDAVYDFVARHRHRILPRAAQCFLPTAEQRGRFLA